MFHVEMYRAATSCGRERMDVQPERLAQSDPDEPFEDSVHIDEEDTRVLSACTSLEPGSADDEPGESDCRPVALVQPGPVRFRYAAPIWGHGADAVELLTEPGERGV